MADEQPSAVSSRPKNHQRTSSTQSAGATGGPRVKAGKHNRNSSYGKNLNKLARLTDGNDAAVKGKSKALFMPPSSFSDGHVKRNKSDITLPSRGSKVHIKKNQSAVQLRRNESHPKFKRSSRPTTPSKQKEEDESQLKGYIQPAFSIDADDEEEEEDEWTEESASQSPVITRNGSMKGLRPNMQNLGQQPMTTRADIVPTPTETRTTPIIEQRQPSQPQRQDSFDGHLPRPPDPSAITNRLLHRSSSQQLAPKLSTAEGSGTTTPARIDSQDRLIPSRTNMSDTPSEPSIASDGVSRFLDPNAASSGRSTYFSSPNLQSTMTSPRLPRPLTGSRTRSPSPNPSAVTAAEQVRRAKSVANLGTRDPVTGLARASANGIENMPLRRPQTGRAAVTPNGDEDPRSITINPEDYRRGNGQNTQLRHELWRTQSAVEQAAQPPAPLMRSMHGQHGAAAVAAAAAAASGGAGGLLGADDRRLRMAEEAEAELAFLRVYRNPAVEAVERVRAERRRKEKRERAGKRGSLDKRSVVDGHGHERANGIKSRPKSVHEVERSQQSQHARSRPSSMHETPHGTPNTNGSADTAVAGGSMGTPARRSVRFSVGGDGQTEDGHDGHDGHEEVTEDESLKELLRSLWEGGEAERVDG